MFRTSIACTAATVATAAILTAGALGFTAPAASANIGQIAAGPVIYGTDSRNALFGTNAANTMYGYGGSDSMFGLGGDDRIYGGNERETVLPGPGKDVVYGEESNSSQREEIYDDDADTDKLSGGIGSDIIHAANGTVDYVDCGEGGIEDDDIAIVDSNDVVSNCETVVKASADAPEDTYKSTSVNYRMGTSAGEYLVVNASSSGEEMDYLVGKGGSDTLNGYADHDQLYGGSGTDYVYGGDDDDTIVDDDGDYDVLVGGAGSDWIAAANGVADKVDCGAGAGDRAFVDAIDTVIGCEVLNPQDG